MSADAAERELVVGRVTAAEDLVGGRAASYLLTVDLGPRGERQASIQAGAHYADRQALVGRQVVCAIADGGAATVLAAHSHAGGLVLLAPELEVENGTVVA